MSEAPIARPAVRILLLDAQDRIFLMFFAPGAGGAGVWITPGGGLEPGETYEQAAVRELWEEIGLHDFELGPLRLASQPHLRARRQIGRSAGALFVVRVDAHEPGEHFNLDEWERSQVTEQRWWPLKEIASASGAYFAPRDLASLLAPIVAGAYPDEPYIVGV